jgi:ribonuclease BN (tRNA processing enzyme)
MAEADPGGRRTSGASLAAGVDLLFHDAQYTAEEYATRVGWGHGTVAHALRPADVAGVGTLAPVPPRSGPRRR